MLWFSCSGRQDKEDCIDKIPRLNTLKEITEGSTITKLLGELKIRLSKHARYERLRDPERAWESEEDVVRCIISAYSVPKCKVSIDPDSLGER